MDEERFEVALARSLDYGESGETEASLDTSWGQELMSYTLQIDYTFDEAIDADLEQADKLGRGHTRREWTQFELVFYSARGTVLDRIYIPVSAMKAEPEDFQYRIDREHPCPLDRYRSFAAWGLRWRVSPYRPKAGTTASSD
jgi:hypothetical protein